MRGDFSRQTFTRAKHYAGVLLQQGRVAVDADFNEQQSIVRHRTETEAVDVIGGCGTPLDPPAYAEASGFRIEISASQTSITIGAGRDDVDGILAENEKTSDYLEQDLPPYEFPSPPPILSLLPDAKEIGLVYLDVWQRQVTPLEDPLIQEKALGEADTATRARTAWQVRVLPLPGVAVPVACNADLAPWNALVAPSTGTLAAITHPPTTAPNPCEPPPSAGFTRLENQLYRVEIHRGGANPTFKWSRENGSILTDVRSLRPATGSRSEAWAGTPSSDSRRTSGSSWSTTSPSSTPTAACAGSSRRSPTSSPRATRSSSPTLRRARTCRDTRACGAGTWSPTARRTR